VQQQPSPYAAVRPTNSLAIVSLIAGIAAYVVAPVIGAVVAIVTGHIARGQVRQTGEAGGGMALAGLILGYVHLALVLVGGVLLAIVLVIAGVALFGAQQA
jgi:hypothetical protein